MPIFYYYPIKLYLQFTRADLQRYSLDNALNPLRLNLKMELVVVVHNVFAE